MLLTGEFTIVHSYIELVKVSVSTAAYIDFPGKKLIYVAAGTLNLPIAGSYNR